MNNSETHYGGISDSVCISYTTYTTTPAIMFIITLQCNADIVVVVWATYVACRPILCMYIVALIARPSCYLKCYFCSKLARVKPLCICRTEYHIAHTILHALCACMCLFFSEISMHPVSCCLPLHHAQ